MFRTLEAHGVRYLLIGGLAATLHGSPLRTGDADICPAKDAANLERLARALEAMDARIRAPDAEAGVRCACDARFLAGVERLKLTTRFGDLDIAFIPAGTGGYDDLLQGAERYDLEGLVVPVASLPDVIRSKKAADRPKDHAALDTLQELLRRRKRPTEPRRLDPAPLARSPPPGLSRGSPPGRPSTSCRSDRSRSGGVRHGEWGPASRNKSFPRRTDETSRRVESRDWGGHRARYARTAWPASTCRDHRHRACSTVSCARTSPTSSPPSMPGLMGVACHRSSPPSSGSSSGVGCWRTASPACGAGTARSSGSCPSRAKGGRFVRAAGDGAWPSARRTASTTACRPKSRAGHVLP